MKKKFLIWIGMMLLLIITGCANDEEVARELIDYYNNDWLASQIMKKENIGPKQNELLRLEDESNERASMLVEEEIIPSMKKVLDYLHNVELEHAEIKELHQINVEAEEFFYKTLKTLPAYYRGEISDDKVDENSEKLKKKYDAFLERRDELMDKYDIVWDEDSYEQGYYKMKLKPNN
ncbi:hypothetical protein F3157_09160 [Virgibacillus dakarensis]|nr:hypothetical protein [Virgibacillus dakarensis]MTW85824.1 hypothetical protein [Virgibacillus dakarensis]